MVPDSEKYTRPVVITSEKHTGKIIITSQDPAEVSSESFHPGSYIEWWFVHGSFEGKECGRRHLMATLFRYDRSKTSDPGSVGYYLLISLMDPATGRSDVISRGEKAIIDRMFSPIKNRRSTNIDPRVLDCYIDELRMEGPAVPVTLEAENATVTEEPFSVAWKDFSFSQEDGKFRLAFTLPGTDTRCRIARDPLSPRHEMHEIGPPSRNRWHMPPTRVLISKGCTETRKFPEPHGSTTSGGVRAGSLPSPPGEG